MHLLMLRLLELAEESFPNINKHQLSLLCEQLMPERRYTDADLIRALDTIEFVQQPMWVDPAGGLHYANETDPAKQYA